MFSVIDFLVLVRLDQSPVGDQSVVLPACRHDQKIAAVTGMAIEPPTHPKRANPAQTDPKATAEWMSIVRRLILVASSSPAVGRAWRRR